MKKITYLDIAAGMPLREEAKKVLIENLDIFANPSSIHQKGQEARFLLDQARMKVAQICQTENSEVIFTSGATESLHLAIIGNYLQKTKPKKVIYASPFLHSAPQKALEFLERNFQVQIKYLPTQKSGILHLEKINQDQISDILSSDIIVVEHGNSEFGLLQPIAKLGKILKKKSQENQTPKPTLIVDAAASILTEKIGLKYQVADFIACSGEKFGGMKGCGILLKNKNQKITPIISGSHEFGIRGGTENLLGIITTTKALEIHTKNQNTQNEKLKIINQKIRQFFAEKLPKIQIITPPREHALHHILHFLSPKISGNLLTQKADLQGICLSSGSACSSGAVSGSTGLKTLGIPPHLQNHGIRISWYWDTTDQDLQKLFGFLSENLKETA